MSRPFLFLCALAAAAQIGCVGYYTPRHGTSDEDLRANIEKSEQAKQERLK